MTTITFQLFAKAPIPGTVKTRLIPALSPGDAAVLHARLVERTAAAVAAARDQVPDARAELWCAPDCADPALGAIAARHALRLRAQQGPDLGARMRHALASAMPSAAILVGSDCPLLDRSLLLGAATALTGEPVVFVPAEDGGYALVGCRGVVPDCFDGIAWGGPGVMSETRHRLARCGARWTELESVWDVDTPADLARLAGDRTCASLLDGLAYAPESRREPAAVRAPRGQHL
jgi:rSAM/selenodomain-associated transferase 1